jgi:hypothetical protein
VSSLTTFSYSFTLPVCPLEVVSGTRDHGGDGLLTKVIK